MALVRKKNPKGYVKEQVPLATQPDSTPCEKNGAGDQESEKNEQPIPGGEPNDDSPTGEPHDQLIPSDHHSSHSQNEAESEVKATEEAEERKIEEEETKIIIDSGNNKETDTTNM